MENQELQGEREITEMLRPPPAAASKLQSRETDSEISTQYSGCGGLSVPTAFSPVPRIRSCNGLVHRVRKSGFDHQARKHRCGTQLAWALRRLSGVSALTSMFISSGALHRRGSSPAAGSGLLHAPPFHGRGPSLSSVAVERGRRVQGGTADRNGWGGRS
jgi:hypothetical protein